MIFSLLCMYKMDSLIRIKNKLEEELTPIRAQRLDGLDSTKMEMIELELGAGNWRDVVDDWDTPRRLKGLNDGKMRKNF